MTQSAKIQKGGITSFIGHKTSLKLFLIGFLENAVMQKGVSRFVFFLQICEVVSRKFLLFASGKLFRFMLLEGVIRKFSILESMEQIHLACIFFVGDNTGVNNVGK